VDEHSYALFIFHSSQIVNSFWNEQSFEKVPHPVVLLSFAKRKVRMPVSEALFEKKCRKLVGELSFALFISHPSQIVNSFRINNRSKRFHIPLSFFFLQKERCGCRYPKHFLRKSAENLWMN